MSPALTDRFFTTKQAQHIYGKEPACLIYIYISALIMTALQWIGLLQTLEFFESREKHQKSKKKYLLQSSGRFSLYLGIQSQMKSTTLQDNPFTGGHKESDTMEQLN